MTKLRKKFIQEEASRVLRNAGIQAHPVDVAVIAQKQGIRVIEDALPDGISGMIVLDGSRRFIFVKADDGKARQRFSIAHELGHFFIHGVGQHANQVGDGFFMVKNRSDVSKTGLNQEEVEANAFAAELLMPEMMLREKVCGRDYLDETEIDRLASDFAVSSQAMTIRLSKLGYL